MNIETQHELLARVEGHLAARTTDMAPHAMRADADHYTDPDVLSREIRHFFRDQPMLVALTPDVPNAGSYMTLDVAGLPLLVVRGDDGVVRTFVNACRHRGSRVASGRGDARSFSCPFHAWNYARDGHLIARSNSCGGFDSVPAEQSGLRELPCREVAGMIFALPAGDDIDGKLVALTGAMREEVDSYDIGRHLYFDHRSIERACSYKFVMDTFCESYHIAALHKQSILPYYYPAPGLTDQLGPVIRMIGVRSSVQKEWPKPLEERRFIRHGTIQYLIPPNVVLTHQVDHIQLWQIYPKPGHPGRCEVNFRLYWPGPMTDEAKKKAAVNIDLIWKVTNEEDFPQCEQAHASLDGKALEHLVFGRNEPALIAYHTQMDQPFDRRLVHAI